MVLRYCVGIVATVVLASAAWAGQIATDSSGNLLVTATAPTVNLHPDYYYAYDLNNDYLGNNLDFLLNGWYYELTFNSNAPIDLVVNLSPTGGITEFEMGVGVTNHTGSIWNSFRLEIGLGTDPFVINPDPDNLDFDTSDCEVAPNSPLRWFAPISRPWSEDSITLLSIGSGDSLGSNESTDITYYIDIPDGISQFTLRHTPIPEPTSLAAMAVMAAGMLLRRRCRHV